MYKEKGLCTVLNHGKGDLFFPNNLPLVVPLHDGTFPDHPVPASNAADIPPPFKYNFFFPFSLLGKNLV
jgi:hypothetical protein